MSALGQRQTLSDIKAMSALPPKADIAERDWHVRFVPKVDIRLGYSITSSALRCNEERLSARAARFIHRLSTDQISRTLYNFL
jgi:hypothetical protein